MLRALLALVIGAAATAALAKLPPPSPEEQARADLAKARDAYSAKRDAFDLCRAMERVAASYAAQMAAAGKRVKADDTLRCQDPGPFAPPRPATGKVS